MHVTSNLLEALHQLRLETEDRILWIDAICIDQEEEVEKGHQVKQMGRIYKEAEQVVIWLGSGTTETDLIMDFMKRLQNTSANVHGDWRILARDGVPRGKTERTVLLEGLIEVLTRPWFRRIWILQEIANARVAKVRKLPRVSFLSTPSPLVRGTVICSYC